MKLQTYGVLKAMAWAVSGTLLIAGLSFSTDPNLVGPRRTLAVVLAQVGGAFFFPLTVGWIVQKARDIEGYSLLWLFSQEFRRAGLLAFYADRKGHTEGDRKGPAEDALERAFGMHAEGRVIMAGASLRLFLNPVSHYYEPIADMLRRKGRRGSIELRALWCSPERNVELPFRSFIEEFSQGGNRRMGEPAFDWHKEITISIGQFRRDYYDKHGLAVGQPERARSITDLESTRTGAVILQGIATENGNSFSYREYESAPYCTVIIFPDVAFYTPNLLSARHPVNLPLMEFHRSADPYRKLVEYVEFLWWASGPREKT